MEVLIKNGNIINFRKTDYVYISVSKISDNSVYIEFEGQTNLFIIDDTKLNGVTYNNADEFINTIESL